MDMERNDLTLFNTLSDKKEIFKPIKDNVVTMYNCGPTVYDYAHIGNLRSYVFADVLRRALLYNGYSVKQVINITDVGHLTSDADEGADKIEEGARREGKKVNTIIKLFTKAFLDDLKKLNIGTKKTHFPKASEHIPEQIAFIQTLDEKGYTYRTSDGIYFDTSLLKDYGKLGNIDIKGLKEGARIRKKDEKRNPTDFALWKFSPPAGRPEEKRQQEWKSPWGVGFPGWHIECSAMSMKHLGKQIDIHTGGIDHIPIHHNNEIAQTESVTGRKFVNYWMHNAFITIEGQKIAKSIGNTIYLRNIADRGFSPLSLRYWFLTAHYKTRINFTWEALEGASAALFKLHKFFVEKLGTRSGSISITHQQRFNTAISDDLDTPRAIALMWELVKDESVEKGDKRATLLDYDRVLGIGLSGSNRRMVEMLSGRGKQLKIGDLPVVIKKLVNEREKARKNQDWEKADRMREEIEQKGYDIEDTDKRPIISKR
jgi:cysteinyl-tRNA synthetase